ncbi:MAG: M15 family metallopeptidase [Bacteroidetes bacterium]|nr:M15 family metallopeptidase [Bacteroidota bacterium]
MFRLAPWCFLLFAAACSENAPPQQPVNSGRIITPDTLVQIDTPVVSDSSLIISRISAERDSLASLPLLSAGLVNIQQIAPEVLVELKYSTTDNFLGFDVYGDLNTAFLQPDVAAKLAAAQKALAQLHPGYRLLVYDAARPLGIQQKMWDTLRHRPLDRSKYVSNPANGGSLHNYGAAVDLTIADSLGLPLDMGSPYDFFGIESHPAHEAELLAAGKLTEAQIENRKLLRRVMRSAGFFGITSEWWHFNSCTRAVAQEKYVLLW